MAITCAIPKKATTVSQPVGPSLQTPLDVLNKKATTLFFASDFREVPRPVDEDQEDSCCRRTFTAYDPRLISAMHNGQRLELNTPPVDQSVKMANVYDRRPFHTGVYSKGYGSIKAGDVTYYVDSAVADPLFLPVFATTANITAYTYVDPMGTVKPHYRRTPQSRVNPVLDKRDSYANGLSSLTDSCEFREDLINLQRQASLQQRYDTLSTF